MEQLTEEDINSGLILVKNTIKKHRISQNLFNKKFDSLFDFLNDRTESFAYEEIMEHGYEKYLTEEEIDNVGTKLIAFAKSGIKINKKVFMEIIENIMSFQNKNGIEEEKSNKNRSIPNTNTEKKVEVEKEVYTAEEAAVFLGFEYRLMGVMRRDGTGPPYSYVRRKYLYTKADLNAYLESNKKYPKKAP